MVLIYHSSKGCLQAFRRERFLCFFQSIWNPIDIFIVGIVTKTILRLTPTIVFGDKVHTMILVSGNGLDHIVGDLEMLQRFGHLP